MEKHKCKLCFKKFSNGRALGGHMRSHMINLPLPPKPAHEQHSSGTILLSFEAESSPSSSSSSSDDDDEKGLSYVLRENPKRSIGLVDPEFSFPVTDTLSVIVHDRESSETETESSKSRSKRHKKLGFLDHKNNNSESVSSVSDVSEEDVAFCLMMMSRDKWKKDQYEDSDDYSLKSWKNNRVRGKFKFKCETCDKVFRSYQALGGHRASHKKMKVVTELKRVNNGVKSHECPVCLRVFASGQALGGHKRTHVTGSSSPTISVIDPSKLGIGNNGNSFLDLNLPAPVDDASLIENSGFR